MSKKNAKTTTRSETARQGTMLILAIFFIVVATSLATLIMASSAQALRTIHSEHEEILLRQLTDSGIAWAISQKGLPTDAPVTLNGNALLPEGIAGDIRMVRDMGNHDVLLVSTSIHLPGRDVSRTSRFRIPS